MRYKRFILLLFLMSITNLGFAHGMSDAEKQTIIDGGNIAYLWLGMTHMLTGYDHLLFVFGMVFFLNNFRDVLKYVTIFTIGHSITLISATYIGLQINFLLVDAIIALSVCYIAFVNMDGFTRFLNLPAPNMMLMIFIIGLIHGTGLSTRLQALPLQQDSLLSEIITFNIGIELGQMAALVVMLLFFGLLRSNELRVSARRLSNAVLVFFGALLFLMQIHGYAHLDSPDEFGFSTDLHTHEHLRMDAENLDKVILDNASHHDSL